LRACQLKKILTLEIFRAGPPHKLESLRACGLVALRNPARLGES